MISVNENTLNHVPIGGIVHEKVKLKEMNGIMKHGMSKTEETQPVQRLTTAAPLNPTATVLTPPPHF